MTPKPDLQSYALGELPERERLNVERYLASNPEAALEVERLRMVMTALERLPEEEPPRRIAFVSDKVFEPRWYQRLWQSGSGLGFAASGMLAASILAHGWMMKPAPAAPVAAMPPAEVSRQVEAEVAKRLDGAVAKAVAEVKAAADAQSHQMVAAALTQAEKKFALDRQADRAVVDASFDTLRKQMNRMVYLASNQRGAEQ